MINFLLGQSNNLLQYLHRFLLDLHLMLVYKYLPYFNVFKRE
nr:MAG TPA: hypothetical protein [Caudoviricetes sp.]